MSKQATFIERSREHLFDTTFNCGPVAASNMADAICMEMPGESSERLRDLLSSDLQFGAMIISEQCPYPDPDEDNSAAAEQLELGLLHLRLASEIRGFIPDGDFLLVLNMLLKEMRLCKLYDLYNDTVREFSEQIVAAAKDLADLANGVDVGLELRGIVDSFEDTLCDVADLQRDAKPELSARARVLITNTDILAELDELDADSKMRDMLKGDDLTAFEHELSKTLPDYIIDLPWEVIYKNVLPRTMHSTQWLHDVLGIILRQKPEYFNEQRGVDYCYGRAVGTVLGIARRIDIISTIHGSEDYRLSQKPLKTSLGFAYGLGLSDYKDEFLFYIQHIYEQFGYEYADELVRAFQRGQNNSQNI